MAADEHGDMPYRVSSLYLRTRASLELTKISRLSNCSKIFKGGGQCKVVGRCVENIWSFEVFS